MRLLHNALSVDEACAADVADLGEDSGHRVLRVVRKGARRAKVPLTPHCLRHSAITFAFDAGTSLRDVQDYAGHKDPRTPRRQRSPATAWTATPPYTVAAYLA